MAVTISRKQIREGAASDLGLHLVTSVAAADIDLTNQTLLLPDLTTKLPDAFQLRDSFVTADGIDYARVIKFHADSGTDKVQLDHNIDGLDDDPTEVHVYFGLSPEEINNQINEALEELYREVRVEITLVADQSDYPIDDQVDSELDTCTWLQNRTQIIDLQFQEAFSTNWNQAYGYGMVSYLRDNNSLTVRLGIRPITTGTASLILRARKPYAWREKLLELDADTTTCPYKLAMAAVQLRCLRLLFKKHGPAMKQNFGQAAAVAERQFAAAINEWTPAMQPASYNFDEPFDQDIAAPAILWSW